MRKLFFSLEEAGGLALGFAIADIPSVKLFNYAMYDTDVTDDDDAVGGGAWEPPMDGQDKEACTSQVLRRTVWSKARGLNELSQSQWSVSN